MGDVCGSLAFFLSKSKGTVRFFIGEHNPTGFTFGFNKEGAVPLNKFYSGFDCTITIDRQLILLPAGLV